METNKISRKLLAEGWTKDQTPPGMRPWSDFNGGWTYDWRHREDVVFEAPCGLLWKRTEFSTAGHMSFMGVEWCEENDCITATCPHFDRQEPCMLNHPLLREQNFQGAGGRLCPCALHETEKPWRYEQSAKKVHDENGRIMEERWTAFAASRRGRVCRHQATYNRSTRQWSAWYDPIECARWGGACRHCSILDADLSEKKGNVFYDLRIDRKVPGTGFIPDTVQTEIIKGKKLLDRQCSITIAESIARRSRKKIQETEEMRHHAELFFQQIIRIEVQNIRAERKETRDLRQDLRDISEGITVRHASDDEKAAKERKRENRKKAADAKVQRLEAMVMEGGFEDQPERLKHRMKKYLGYARIEELLAQREAASDRPHDEPEQLSLFDGEEEQ